MKIDGVGDELDVRHISEVLQKAQLQQGEILLIPVRQDNLISGHRPPPYSLRSSKLLLDSRIRSPGTAS